MSIGIVLAMLGAALSIGLGGAGSAWGVGLVGKAGAGLLAEEPKHFGQTLLLMAIPGSQGIYGFLVAVLILQNIGMIGGTLKTLTPEQGLAIMMVGIPVGLTCLVSGGFQGKVAASSLSIVAKDPSRFGQGIILAAMVETFAILGLLISILMLTGTKIA